MPITLVVMACIGPLCSYATMPESFDSVARCERLAPFVVGMERANLTSLMGYPRDGGQQSAFSCIDSSSGKVLVSYEDRPITETKVAARNLNVD